MNGLEVTIIVMAIIAIFVLGLWWRSRTHRRSTAFDQNLVEVEGDVGLATYHRRYGQSKELHDAKNNREREFLPSGTHPHRQAKTEES